MAGIYVHIPFCQQKCNYCDFYKTTQIQFTDSFLSSLQKEIELTKNYLQNKPVNTVYFGGGTPSVLKGLQLYTILEAIKKHYLVNTNAEITIEVNPDDVSAAYYNELFSMGFNRLSIGIQSFNNDLLIKMNRRHNAQHAIKSVVAAKKSGFKNISIDLIYGIPGQTLNDWTNSLIQSFNLQVDHLSAYHLTYHKQTRFYKWLKKGVITELTEKQSLSQFNKLIDFAHSHGFEQYEISNFAKNNKYSVHNTAYWQGKSFLGLGPSAHSFDGNSRRWNVSNVKKYMLSLENEKVPCSEEILSENNKYNEYILTRIRTKWGISTTYIQSNFGMEKKNDFVKKAEPLVHNGLMKKQNESFLLTRKGIFISDRLSENFMII